MALQTGQMRRNFAPKGIIQQTRAANQSRVFHVFGLDYLYKNAVFQKPSFKFSFKQRQGVGNVSAQNQYFRAEFLEWQT